MIEIRALGADDWALTRALRLAALVDSPEAFGGTYAESVQRSAEQWREWPRDGQVFAAVVDGEPVGMGCGWRPPGASGTHLIGMWIAPAARGTGLAPRLIDAVAQWARGNGSDALDLVVYETNPRAYRAYLKYGFVNAGPNAQYPGGIDMRLPLT